jgi:hypothetical protein
MYSRGPCAKVHRFVLMRVRLRMCGAFLMHPIVHRLAGLARLFKRMSCNQRLTDSASACCTHNQTFPKKTTVQKKPVSGHSRFNQKNAVED